MNAAIPVPEVLDIIANAAPSGLLITDARLAQEIEICRQWGYPVRVAESRATLPEDPDLLVPAWIEREVPALAWSRLAVRGFLRIGSTNEEALIHAARGAEPGLLIYAEQQTEGRGRKGRRWNSPPGVGLYFTLVVRSRQHQSRWPLLTHVASLALVQALEEFSNAAGRPLAIDLKWPNDVLLSGKKAAGILLETAISSGGISAAAVGVGINTGQACVPDELLETATSVSREAGAAVPRRQLLVSYLRSFQRVFMLFENGRHEELLEKWKSRSSMCDGVPVQVLDGNSTKHAVTCGLSGIGGLRIRLADGVEETVLAGDVTVRCQY
jgi:BirA family biotin operon repressor/biotin-[acetyl-CoA-carboxylase] ligase